MFSEDYWRGVCLYSLDCGFYLIDLNEMAGPVTKFQGPSLKRNELYLKNTSEVEVKNGVWGQNWGQILLGNG